MPTIRTILCYSVLKTVRKFVLVVFKLDFSSLNHSQVDSESLQNLLVHVSFGFQHFTEDHRNQVKVPLKDLLLRLPFQQFDLERFLFGTDSVKVRKQFMRIFEKGLSKIC